jgi:TatD DNase family protein
VHFTIGAEVLYSEHIQMLAREAPLGQLLTETDNPGGPKEFLGRAGMPTLVREIAQKIAEVRETTVEAATQSVHSSSRGE